MHDRLADLIRTLEAVLAGDPGWRDAAARAHGDATFGALAQLIERAAQELETLRREHDLLQSRERLAAAGALAGSMAQSLATPLARVREALGQTCDLLDKHVALSKGPDPLPRQQVSYVREVLADAYMDASRSARLAADLAAVVGPSGSTEASIDLNEIVERAVALAGHRVADESELLLDLGSVPPVTADSSRLAQALAHLLLDAADSVGKSGSIVVRTFEDGEDVVVTVIHSPAGTLRTTFAALVRDTVATQGGRLRFEREDDRALAELRFARA